MKHALTGLIGILTLTGGFASAQEALTLEEALAQAQRSPAALEARARIEEARGRLTDASVLLRDNPVLQGGRGPRTGEDGDFVDSEVELSQWFELGGRRRARVAGAEADVAATEAEADGFLRELLRDTADAFLRALYSQERRKLSEESERIASETLAAAQRRFQSGDVAILDVNVSQVALVRARAEILTAQAGAETALRDLRIRLGLGPEQPIAPSGDFQGHPGADLQELLSRASRRADIRRLDARLRQAEADSRLARAMSWPGLGVGLRKAREEGDDITQAMLSFSLPIFQRGQGMRVESAAVQQRLQTELTALKRAVEVEVRAAARVAELRQQVAAQLEAEALPLSVENEALARRSYETGQIGLTDLLALRRETLETRLRSLDARLDAALAAFELRVAAGEIP